MVEIINLRKERKNKKRKDKDIKAQQNRIDFGQSKQDNNVQNAINAIEQKKLDGHLRDCVDHKSVTEEPLDKE